MDYKELMHKQKQLDEIKIQLNKEFFGIHQVITQIMDTISPWYLFNHLQESPLIVNLWGLTGTGKTALVKRLVELLDKKQAFFHFDMGDLSNKSLNRELSEALKVYEGDDYIICLDEFQHAKSKDEMNKETKIKTDFNIWNFLDTGEFDFSSIGHWMKPYISRYDSLKTWIEYGFKLENGLVYINQQPQKIRGYIKRLFETEETDEFVESFDKSERIRISKLFSDRFKNIFEFDKFYFNSNENDILCLLFEASRKEREQEKGKMKKSLVFILGNLDEAYRMSENFNADISADAFYKISLRINISDIKYALKRRFRNEQIARLGNNHVIYPALSERAFQKIIEVKLQSIATKFLEYTQIRLEFSDSIFDMLFKNGVYPTQGVRPLLSSIKTYIDAKLGNILTYMLENEISANLIKMDLEKNNLIATYIYADEVLASHKLQLDLSLENIRSKTNNNKKAVTAIHEAGHAVVSIVLLKEIPSQLNANSTDAESDGFMFSDADHDIIAKHQLLKMLARFLAGLEAEALIFGESNITLGASSDYQQATEFALKAFRESGMGGVLGYHQKASTQNPFTFESKLLHIEDEVMKLLHEAKLKARDILLNEKTLLLKIASFLVTNNSMNKSDLENHIEGYAKSISLQSIKEDEYQNFYAQALQKAVTQIPKEDLAPDQKLADSLYEFLSLNKDQA